MAVTEGGALHAWGQGQQSELRLGADEGKAETPTVVVRRVGGPFAACDVTCGGHRADEKDLFKSSFKSTDEEEEAGGDEERDSIAERYIQEEERRIRRVCTSYTSKYRPVVDLTTEMLRKRKQSCNG